MIQYEILEPAEMHGDLDPLLPESAELDDQSNGLALFYSQEEPEQSSYGLVTTETKDDRRQFLDFSSKDLDIFTEEPERLSRGKRAANLIRSIGAYAVSEEASFKDLAHKTKRAAIKVADLPGINVITGAVADLYDPGTENDRWKARALIGAGAASEIVTAVRAASLISLPLAFEIAGDSGSPLKIGLGALAVSSANFLWWKGSCSAISESLNFTPRTLRNMKRSKLDVGFRALQHKSQSDENSSNLQKFKNVQRQGLAAFYCLTPQIYAAALENQGKEEKRKLVHELCTSGALVIGELAVASTVIVAAVHEQFPDAANFFAKDAANAKYYIGAMFAWQGLKFTGNKAKELPAAARLAISKIKLAIGPKPKEPPEPRLNIMTYPGLD